MYGHLPSYAGVAFINRLPDTVKMTRTPKALSTGLKNVLASKTFYVANLFPATKKECIYVSSILPELCIRLNTYFF